MRMIATAAIAALMMCAPAHALCLWNCQPSASDMRSSFEAEWARSYSDTAYTIESFNVLQAYEIKGPFGPVYNAQVEATIFYPSGVKGPLGNFFVEPGGRKTYRKNMEFLKTDKGWLGKDGKIY